MLLNMVTASRPLGRSAPVAGMPRGGGGTGLGTSLLASVASHFCCSTSSIGTVQHWHMLHSASGHVLLTKHVQTRTPHS